MRPNETKTLDGGPVAVRQCGEAGAVIVSAGCCKPLFTFRKTKTFEGYHYLTSGMATPGFTSIL